MSLKNFVQRIPQFDTIPTSIKIDYFVYFLIYENKHDGITSKDVSFCFDELHLMPYSNIPSYLNRLSKRGSGQKFLKRNELFYLENSTKIAIEKIVKKEIELQPSDSLFPKSLFDDTRGYLIGFAKEAACAYDYALYNSCFFMLRKILETLIIELFERHGLESKIKNGNGGYLFLSDLISKLIAENKWHLTKIVKEDIPKIKKLADSSVHSKRFSAKKTDIDNIKVEIRIILQELIGHIDYPSWSNG